MNLYKNLFKNAEVYTLNTPIGLQVNWCLADSFDDAEQAFSARGFHGKYVIIRKSDFAQRKVKFN